MKANALTIKAFFAAKTKPTLQPNSYFLWDLLLLMQLTSGAWRLYSLFLLSRLWDNNTWFDSQGNFDWSTLDCFQIVAIAFSPDGKTIAGAGGLHAGDISLWQSGVWDTVLLNEA